MSALVILSEAKNLHPRRLLASLRLITGPLAHRPVGRRCRGTVTAELALILPTLLILVFGALEFGRVFQAWVIVNNAAREGARYAAIGLSAAEVRSTVVLPYLQESGLGGGEGVQLPSASDIQVSIDDPGGQVMVGVPVWIRFYVPIVSNLLPSNPLQVGAQTTMRRQ